MDVQARIVSSILNQLADQCKVGVTGIELDALAEKLIERAGATSVNKGYTPKWAKGAFPNVLSISPNGVTHHGVPNTYKFRDGDIVTIDIGIKKDGLCGDAALTVPIGKVSGKVTKLLYFSRLATYEVLSKVKAGANTRDIALHIQKWAAKNHYTINRKAAGHTIGPEMHMKPNIYNTVEDDVHAYAKLVEGQYICVEPILTTSRDTLGAILPDGWTNANMDFEPAAMFEHMAMVTKDGYKLLTDHFNDRLN